MSVIAGRTLHFRTAGGVFSSRRVDQGSQLLLVTLQEQGMLAEFTSTLLDLGCGYGVLGISLATLTPRCSVVMVERNERAASLARQNVIWHDLQSRVVVLAGDGFSPVADRRFGMIVSNPPVRAGKALLYHWFASAPTHLHPGGSLWLVLRKQQGAASAWRELECHFPIVDCLAKRHGFWILRATRT